MKQDPKEVASKQAHEIAYICKRFKVKKYDLLEVMKALGKSGKYCRSRGKIYARLKELGYTVHK